MMVSRNKSSFRRLVLTAALLSISALMVLGGLDEIARADDAVPVLTRGEGRFVLLSDGRVVGFDSPNDWANLAYLTGLLGVKDIAAGGSFVYFTQTKDEINYSHYKRIGQLAALTNSGALNIVDSSCGASDAGTVDCTYLPAREVPLKNKVKEIGGSDAFLAYIDVNGRLYLHKWREIREGNNTLDFRKALAAENKISFTSIDINTNFVQISVFEDMIAARDDKKHIFIIGNKAELYEKFGQAPNKLSLNDMSYVMFQANMPIERLDLGKLLYIRESNGNLYSLGRLSYKEEHSLFAISLQDYDLKYKNLNYGQISLIDKNVKAVFALAQSTIFAHNNRQVTYMYRALGNFLFGDSEGEPVAEQKFGVNSNRNSLNSEDNSKFYVSNSRYEPDLFLRDVEIVSIDESYNRIIIIVDGKIYISGWTDVYGYSVSQVKPDCGKLTTIRNTVEIDIPNCLKR